MTTVFFRELTVSSYNTKTRTMGDSDDSVKEEQQGDRVPDKGKLRVHLDRAVEDAMKEKPSSDATDFVDDKTEAGVKVGGAAGYITGCADRGALSSSEEEEEEMWTAPSTLSQAQRKVFSTFPFIFATLSSRFTSPPSTASTTLPPL